MIPADNMTRLLDVINNGDEILAQDLLLYLIETHGIDQDQADAIMTAARVIDPTDSDFAAELRDTIRDNADNVIV